MKAWIWATHTRACLRLRERPEVFLALKKKRFCSCAKTTKF